MTRKVGVRWHLRELMATKGMFMTTDLASHLVERGIDVSREQESTLAEAAGRLAQAEPSLSEEDAHRLVNHAHYRLGPRPASAHSGSAPFGPRGRRLLGQCHRVTFRRSILTAMSK